MTQRLETSPDSPVPVRVVAIKIGEWIARLGEIWIDGQVAQLNRRAGVATQFITLRDPDANISLQVTCPTSVLPDAVVEGSRIVLRARPDYWLERGSFSMRALEMRQVGLGELLARLEALRKLLAAEGLFAADRKRPLPFLPRTIGLITGRASAAERDIVENARRRLPGARFRLENVATQGATAVNEIIDALERLDRDPDIDLIVIARGGGSVEDLLPFSNESLVRAVSAAFTPVVSAIGHETDRPLLDLVADLAASTPTDAAKRIVPDLADELRAIRDARARVRSAIQTRIERERELMAGLPQRLRATVSQRLEREREDATQFRQRARVRLRTLLDSAATDLGHVLARARSLSPQATLDRGYAVVRTRDGILVRQPADGVGALRIRVAGGEFEAVGHEAVGARSSRDTKQ